MIMNSLLISLAFFNKKGIILKNNKYNKVMKEVYDEIYPDHYKYKNTELNHTKNMLLKNLNELEITLDSLKTKTVFNIGTGIETIAFHELGAKQIFHYDISNTSVKRLQQLKSSNKKFKNINSSQKDVCEVGLKIPDKIDIVYLVGVLHHFHSPIQALNNILPNVNINGRLFIRIYRSGNLRSFVADFARKFISDSCRPLFNSIYKSKFGDFKYGNGAWKKNIFAHLYQIMFDDLFVPTLFFFKPDLLENFFYRKWI